jgi:hypothetical protein
VQALLTLVLAATPLSETALANTVIADHNRCRTERDAEACRFAEAEYREYLQRFPDNKKAPDLHFFFAELLYDQLEKHEEAAGEYEKAYAANPNGKYARLAAYNRVLAWNVLSRRLPSATVRDLNESVAIPRERRQLIDAADALVARFPDHASRLNAEYSAAKVLYDHNDAEAANRRLGAIALALHELKVESGEDLRAIAANLILDDRRLRNDWSQVKAWALRFQAAGIGGDSFKDDLLQLLAGAEVRLERLSDKAAANVWRAAGARAKTPSMRLNFQSRATQLDGDHAELIAAHFAHLEADPSTDNLRRTADALEAGGRAEDAAQMRTWADFIDGPDAEDEPSEGDQHPDDDCALTEEP